jgi:type IV pilus assembly protein PilE
MKRSRGFTLIELMVVLAVVGILMAIAVPAFNEQLRKSRRSEALQGLGDLVTQQENWRTSHPTYAAAANLRMPTSTFYTFAVTTATATAWTATATPIAGGAQDGDRCGVYTFAVDNIARPGAPPQRTPTDPSCD